MMPRRLAAGLAALAVLGAAAGVAYGAFAATTSNPASSIQAQRVYPGTRTTSAWTIEDAADGSAANTSAPMAYANDGLTYTSSAWTTTFQSTRYIDFDFNSPLPAGVPVAGATFGLDFQSNGGNTGCMYFEVRRASTGTVLGTFGSTGTPASCQGTALGSSNTDISSVVTSTDIANDLRIRVYGKETNSKGFKVDRATVSGAAWSGFTLYRTRVDDTANGTSSVTNWSLNAVDGTAFQNAGNWSNAYASGRYLKFTFPSYLPSAAVITNVDFKYTYKSFNAADTTCYYFEVYNGAGLIGTHGSTSSDVDCNATTSYETITTGINEVDTPTEANNLVVKLYQKVSGNRPALADAVQVVVTYGLPYGTTCADTGTKTIETSGDSWIQQDGAGASSNFGTDTLLDVKANAAKNRRALVTFALPTLPYQCSVTAATLRMYLNTTGGTRTMNASQISSSWTESGVTWNTQPTTTGSPVGVSTGSAGTWTQWTVTSIVQAQYSGSNYGFMIKDSAEDTGNIAQAYMSRENSNVPALQITLG